MRVSGLACALFALVAGCTPPSAKPNVLFILIDTLRRDHLSLYGYHRPTSPNIDAVARDGWVFDNHVSHGAQTVPSTLSIMLSQLPAEHGFVHRFDGQFAKERPLYGDDLVFLSEALQDAGYQTAGFVANPFLGEQNGFDQGFDHFLHALDGTRLSNDAKRWMKSAAGEGKPFFLYLHYMEVHAPYNAPKEFAKRFAPAKGRVLRIRNGPRRVAPKNLECTRAMYDSSILHVDSLIGDVLSQLDALDLREETLIVITSDHGEEFLEHGGLGHGTSVYGELVRAPLILSYAPRFAKGKRITHLSRHLDLASTLLDVAGIEPPSSFRGGSLLEPAARAFTDEGAWRAVYSGDLKLILDTESDRTQLFRSKDQLDVNALDLPESEATLREMIDEYRQLEAMSGDRRKSGLEWSPEQLETLRSLGYVK